MSTRSASVQHTGPTYLTYLTCLPTYKHSTDKPHHSHARISFHGYLFTSATLAYAMSSSIPTQVAEVIQTAHINRAPSPRHDLNPSTAASTREPVYLSLTPEEQPHPRRELDDDDDDDDDEEDEEIPLSVLVRPRAAARRPRAASFPPMPDLRFEQSYLRSIAGAETWGRVAWITVRDQVCASIVLRSSVVSFLPVWCRLPRGRGGFGSSRALSFERVAWK